MRFVDERYDDAPETDPERDVPNVRYVHTKHGFSVKLERRDPYGFVYVTWNKGPTPEKLSGAYSDYDRAREAVTSYFCKETINKVVDEPVEIEKAQYKRRKLNG